MEFINRGSELDFLEKQYKKPTASLIPIYGRRRVGKSRLITEFVKDKEHVYHLAAQESKQEQVKNFKNTIAKKLEDEYLQRAKISDWKDLFAYLKNNPPKEKLIIAIDEVTFIIKRNKAFPSYLQKFWDTYLKETDTTLILCGSLVGMMKESILNYSSPLYGRRSGQIHLKQLKPMHLNERINNLEKTIRFYSIFGGIPKYYEVIDLDKTFQEVVDYTLQPENLFFEEGTFLLGQEFKELGNYNSILKSISRGNTELSNIANDIGMKSRPLSNYLDKLFTLGFVKREKPVTNTQKRYRGYRYYLNDNFMDYWFKFIFPNRNYIEERTFEYKDIEEKLELFISKKFEDICRDTLYKKYNKVGRWWYKNSEIDIVALNENTDEIMFGECKWSDNVNAKALYRDLKTKKGEVRWNNEDRKEKYALFARSFKTDITEDEIACFDLKKMESAMK